jgi:hypothetical protein
MSRISEEDPRVKPSPFQVGQLVKKLKDPMAKIRPRFQPRWLGPYRITQVHLRDVYSLETLEGEPLPNPVNHDILAPWISYPP